MSAEELNMLLTQIDVMPLGESQKAQMKIALLQSALFSVSTNQGVEKENPINQKTEISTKEKSVIPSRGYIKFTRKEIAKMPKEMQLFFIYDNKIVPYRFIHGVYQARFRKLGFDIEVAHTDYEIMKTKFITKFDEKAKEKAKIEAQITQVPEPQIKQNGTIKLLSEYGEEWLAIKEAMVKPSTFKEYSRTFHKDVIPAFEGLTLGELTRSLIQKKLLEIFKETPKKAEKIYLQLSCICDMAADDFGIPTPMKKVELPYREIKKGSALTKAEERTLVDYCVKNAQNATSSAILILYLFGLRKSELKTLKVIDENWVEVITSKEKMGKNEEARRIPITSNARKLLSYINFDKAVKTNVWSISSTLDRLFPKDKVKPHHPHELRYTFITRCKECGVNPELVMLWDGHEEDKDVKASKVDRGYTDYSEEYQLEQAKLVDYNF